MPVGVWTSVAREGIEASLSVPPPVSAPHGLGHRGGRQRTCSGTTSSISLIFLLAVTSVCVKHLYVGASRCTGAELLSVL